jgi:hypothetical protein
VSPTVSSQGPPHVVTLFELALGIAPDIALVRASVDEFTLSASALLGCFHSVTRRAGSGPSAEGGISEASKAEGFTLPCNLHFHAMPNAARKTQITSHASAAAKTYSNL